MPIVRYDRLSIFITSKEIGGSMGANRRAERRSNSVRGAGIMATGAGLATVVSRAPSASLAATGVAASALGGWKAGKAIKNAVKNKNKKAIAANEAQDVVNRKRRNLYSKPTQGPKEGNKGYITRDK